MGYTARDIIRHYATDVRNGHADTDLTPRQRRLTAVVLATASNTQWADTAYPPSDDDRDRIIRAAMQLLWDGNATALLDAIGPSARADYSAASERAVTILRNI